MKKYVFLLTLFSCLNQSVKAQYVTIPDPNFVALLNAWYPACMNGNQMDTTCNQIVNLDQLYITGLAISDLTGIQYFDNISYLECIGNQLTSLSNLPSNLVTIMCQSNQLTSLSGLPNSLKYINCGFNQLTSLPNLPNGLENLICESNQLISLPNLPDSLWALTCGANQLVNLPNLPDSLRILYCQDNQLINLPLLPSNLGVLFCSGNQLSQLTDLPLSLFELYCFSNQLSFLPELPLSLNVLDCSFNNLVSLPVLPSYLFTLFCGNNPILNLPTLPDYLDYLRCNNTLISYLPSLPNSLLMLECDSNYITCLPQISNDITQLKILGNPINCLPNYTINMDSTTLTYPLCNENDFNNNPNGCNPSNGIVGSIYYEGLVDCYLEASDLRLDNFPIKLFDDNNSLIRQEFSLSNGIYQFPVDVGTYNVKIDTANIPFTIQCLNSDNDTTIILTTQNTLAQNINFPLTCKPGFDIGTKSILTNGWVFPGQNHELKITAGDLSQFYSFNCASNISGQVVINVSGPVTYQTNTIGTLTPTVNGNTFTYDISDFGTTDIFNSFGLIFQTDTTAQTGDQICVTVSVTPEVGDNNPSNNFYEYCYNVANSYDPNMKEVYPVNVEPGYDEYFTYTIHFQNTGTAPAFNIRLVDTLDANLDLETFQITNYSHYQTANVRDNILTFHFPNIMLPDSTSNPEGSKGYVQYRIKPKANLALGTQIKNTANIYFDYNDPIVTNTTVNEYVLSTNALKENEKLVARVFPNPMNSTATIQFNKKMKNVDLSLCNVFGQQVKAFYNVSGDKFTFSKENLPSGIYYLSFQGGESNQRIKIIITE